MFKDKEHKVETLLRKCTEGKGVIFKNLLALSHWFGCKCIISVIFDEEFNDLKYTNKE